MNVSVGEYWEKFIAEAEIRPLRLRQRSRPRWVEAGFCRRAQSPYAQKAHRDAIGEGGAFTDEEIEADMQQWNEEVRAKGY